MNLKIICFLLLFFIGHIQSEEILAEWQKALHSLNNEEREILEAFFRTMLVNSEGGFVLTGSKPVCMEGIQSSENFNIRQIGSKAHRCSVTLREGYRIWEKYFASIPSKKLIICCKNHPDHLYSDWIHFLWINPVKLGEVVKENLILFQYVLGPQITPLSFINFLADPSEDVPHDYTLTGIFLGFGSQNSLYHRRVESLQNQIFSREDPPLKAIHERFQLPKSDYLGFDSVESSHNEPSFGFSTLGDEYHTLSKMGISSYTKSTSRSNIPLFSVYKNDHENQELLARYQEDQKKLNEFLRSHYFLEEILSYIFK